MKPKGYAPGDKVWLNSKYIKTKQKRKLEAKFFRLFRVLHLLSKQAYKLELLKKQRLHNIFHVSLLEKDITRKKRVKKVWELDASNDSKKYKIEVIWDKIIYINELESGHLSGLYYLVAWRTTLWKKILKNYC